MKETCKALLPIDDATTELVSNVLERADLALFQGWSLFEKSGAHAAFHGVLPLGQYRPLVRIIMARATIDTV
ncbi:MAG: hypothetical protein CME78_15505 [Halomonas sp.]|nr:hypothetical protein [Halomonas sp.]